MTERVDRINRGSFWFDFDDLSEDEPADDASGNADTVDKALLDFEQDPNAPICADGNGMPRGKGIGCCCPCYLRHGSEEVRWFSPVEELLPQKPHKFSVGEHVEVRDRCFPNWVPGRVTAVNPVRVVLDGMNGPGSTWEAVRPASGALAQSDNCDACGHPATKHEYLYTWHTAVIEAMKSLSSNGKGGTKAMPSKSFVPRAALTWDMMEVALFVLTKGIFDPRVHGRGPPQEVDPQQSRVLVSVVTPTSESRQAFHPLLYESFRSQTYEPRELIIVDTGRKPSPFLEETSRQDKRVIYRWWPVEDARMQDLSEIIPDTPEPESGTAGGGSFISGKDKLLAMRRKGDLCHWPAGAPPAKLDGDDALRAKLSGRVRGGVRREGWTLGRKRNIACHLARGAVLAHFDDDDLYAPNYLEAMLAELCEIAGVSPEAKLPKQWPPTAVTLGAWHVMDFADQAFGYFSPLDEPLLHKSQREPFAYGFGFSYVYTRSAWMLAPFSDVEWAEDGKFTESLLAKGHRVGLVATSRRKGEEALAAHSYHRETTSGGEFADMICKGGDGQQVSRSVRMGTPVCTPSSMSGLLPVVRRIASSQGFKPWDIHPARYDTAERPVVKEVGLQDKEEFLRENPVRTANGRILA